MSELPAAARVRTYRDTGSVEPGSEPIFGSVSGSENQIFGILCDKDTFCLYYRYILWFFRYRACILVLVRRSILSVSVQTLPKTLFMDYAYCDSLTNSKVFTSTSFLMKFSTYGFKQCPKLLTVYMVIILSRPNHKLTSFCPISF